MLKNKKTENTQKKEGNAGRKRKEKHKIQLRVSGSALL